MKQDLINLRKQLQEEQEFVRYEIIDNQLLLRGDSIDVRKIQEMENTDEVIANCEAYMKEVIKILVKYGIPFSSIKITTGIILMIRKEMGAELQKDNLSRWKMFLHELATNALKPFVYVKFRVYLYNCFLSNQFVNSLSFPSKNVEEYARMNEMTSSIYREIDKLPQVSGIVDFSKFVHILRDELGYNVELEDYGEIFDFDDYLTKYVLSCKGRNFVPKLGIKADLEKEKSLGVK